MPNIIEYNSQSEITPSDKGIQAAEVAGRRIGSFYHQLEGDVQNVTNKITQHMAVMETSELYKTGTELRLGLQKRYEQESALPENRNDPHFGDRFMAEVAPQLDQWGSGASTDHGKQLAATLKASIRNELFNHVAAGQSAMDWAHVRDNANQTINMLGAGLVSDPSAANLERTLGTAKDAIQGMTMNIPDVDTRERTAAELNATALLQLVLSRYRGVAESIKQQIAQTGDVSKSPAAAQMDKDLAAQVGFQYITPEHQAALSALKEEAVRSGQEQYKAGVATAKSNAIEQGKAAYAQVDTAMTDLITSGKPPTPDLVAAIDQFAQRYGATNPGEVHALNDARIRAQESAQKGTVEPYNPKVWSDIQNRLSLPSTDPHALTNTSLLQAWGSHQITTEQLKLGQEMVARMKPGQDPGFKPAYEAFERWQKAQVAGIGNNGAPGTAAARAQFIHDTTALFMGRGRAGGDWDKTLKEVTDSRSPLNISNAIAIYKTAANRPDASAYLQKYGREFHDDGTITAYGSPANPVYPTRPSAGAANAPAQPTKLDQKAVDAAIWGNH